MTTGIYMLKFKGTDKVYIGKGTNIWHRWSDHQFKFIHQTHARKMMEAYDIYGMPSIHVLLECTEEELNENENLAIDIFDAVNNGFNTLPTAESSPDGASTPGELNGMAKYTNEKILEAFHLLLDINNNIQDISNKVGISYGVLLQISCGRTHRWIEKIHPDKYALLLEIKGTRKKLRSTEVIRDIKYPKVLSPEGIEYTISHLETFCKRHGLDPSNLRKVFKGTFKQHKKWTLKP